MKKIVKIFLFGLLRFNQNSLLCMDEDLPIRLVDREFNVVSISRRCSNLELSKAITLTALPGLSDKHIINFCDVDLEQWSESILSDDETASTLQEKPILQSSCRIVLLGNTNLSKLKPKCLEKFLNLLGTNIRTLDLKYNNLGTCSKEQLKIIANFIKANEQLTLIDISMNGFESCDKVLDFFSVLFCQQFLYDLKSIVWKLHNESTLVAKDIENLIIKLKKELED